MNTTKGDEVRANPGTNPARACGAVSGSTFRRILFVAICVVAASGCNAPTSRSRDIRYTPDGTPYLQSAYQAGRDKAQRDIRAGHLIIEDYGFPRKGQAAYAEILQQRYQIKLRRLAGDVVNETVIGHAKGYNEVAEAEIKRRFGDDILRAAEEEAERLHEKSKETR